jgi:ABC-type branched-subunit amino acid transport system substrate-binding protein
MKLPFFTLPVIAGLLALSACESRDFPDFTRERAAAQKKMSESAPMTVEAPVVEPKGVIPANTPALKVALLLPLSGDSLAVGNAMLDAATMAISDSYLTVPSNQIKSQVILMPKDTGNTPADSAKAVKQALDQGASFVVGPLFSQSVRVVAPMLKERNINMLTFSNNAAVAGNGVYLFGFLPEEQVVRVAEYAYLHNLQRVALLAPNDSYGEKVKKTLMDSYAHKGGVVAPAELYAPSPANIDAAVTRLSQAYANLPEDKRFQAIFIADGGNQLKNIIISLKRSKIDLTKIKLLGTGLWDDPEIASMPEMEGAWFSSSPPDSYQVFEKRFVATYGYKPVRLASLAYDAVTLVSTIAMANPGAAITPEALTVPGGFMSPANGLFRLNADGTSERRLAIMEVSGGSIKVIDPALRNF